MMATGGKMIYAIETKESAMDTVDLNETRKVQGINFPVWMPIVCGTEADFSEVSEFRHIDRVTLDNMQTYLVWLARIGCKFANDWWRNRLPSDFGDHIRALGFLIEQAINPFRKEAGNPLLPVVPSAIKDQLANNRWVLWLDWFMEQIGPMDRDLALAFADAWDDEIAVVTRYGGKYACRLKGMLTLKKEGWIGHRPLPDIEDAIPF